MRTGYTLDGQQQQCGGGATKVWLNRSRRASRVIGDDDHDDGSGLGNGSAACTAYMGEMSFMVEKGFCGLDILLEAVGEICGNRTIVQSAI